MNSEFSRLHPLTILIFFVILLSAGAFTVQPVFIALSLSGAFCFAIKLGGITLLKKAPLLLFPLLVSVLINVLFNHRGVTVLARFPSGNTLTLEAFVYGLLAGCMLCGAIIWFYCFGKIFTADKLMCITGKLFPSLTMIISMTVRSIPLFVKRFRKISDAQTQLGFGYSNGNIFKRLKNLARIFSILINNSLESSVETSDSMRSRGYGIAGRTSFNMFRFTLRDLVFIIFFLVIGGFVIFGEINSWNAFTCYPRFHFAESTFLSVIQLSAFGLLSFVPFIYELSEDHKWRSLVSKI